MKHFSIAITLAALVAFAPNALAANPVQSGTATTCAEYNVTYNLGVTTGLSDVVVAPNSVYFISADAGTAYVDFFDADGFWLGYSEGRSTGVVPAGAALGVVCVGIGFGYPEVPDPTATWSYQDGF